MTMRSRVRKSRPCRPNDDSTGDDDAVDFDDDGDEVEQTEAVVVDECARLARDDIRRLDDET